MDIHKSKIHKSENYPFWFGGTASCIATSITHPLDFIKVRMQTSKQRSIGVTPTIINIIRNEGNKIIYF
ncbi:unnamed protein product [Pneumocystis jirovecii]|uniref:Mitochondrial carrier protein n=1 Tax=Pneumocystis jirovecii TaxID=42068 RepID=L0PCM2_PNEJI|nr:unnamed protein product [Pneumocystis jirovecii]